MDTFVLLSFCVVLPQAFSKLLQFELLFSNIDACKKVHRISESGIIRLFNHSIVYTEHCNRKELCFLDCIYRSNNVVSLLTEVTPVPFLLHKLTDGNGLITEDGLASIMEKIMSFRSNSSISMKTFTLNTKLLCNRNNGESESCLNSVETMECIEAMIYLYMYGFTNASMTWQKIETEQLEDIFRRSLSEFQTHFGLNATGTLNYETLTVMYSARYVQEDTKPRYKRYVKYKNKWKKKNLTYEISKYSAVLSPEAVDLEIWRAFEQWSSVIPLTVTPVRPGHGDIVIRFEKFDHGDVPFDGAGFVRAHTFYPITFPSGEQKSFIHFDDSENWTVNSTKGVNFFQTALHEVGHSLGLKHSSTKDSVMWPGRKINYDLNITLYEDDILGIQSLYGRKN